MSGSTKYRILHELGGGGMGRIHKGLLVGQAGFLRPIVIKRLRDTGDPLHLRLFVDEARRYALLDHENIGRIFDFEEVDSQLCIIMEYIDGWSLVEYVRRHAERGRLPDLELSVFIASRVCRALQYVFEKARIVHRDVSPANVMMTREGAVKLIDFGIATRSGTRESTLTGKPAYMAPEMIAELRADQRSDIFGLGVVLYELLSGQRLFGGSSPTEVLAAVLRTEVPDPRAANPAVPDALLEILRQALERAPEKRFASAAEMGAACEHFLYDKGYGPTNLTLKHYLLELFPEVEPADPLPEEAFPELEAELLPIDDGPRAPVDEAARTAVRPLPPGDHGTLPPR
jgi:serine/threonine-protein kinase